jgi:hypothetical protein
MKKLDHKNRAGVSAGDEVFNCPIKRALNK